MKILIAKISTVAFLLAATVWLVNVQSVRASADASTTATEVVDMDQAKTAMGVTCTGWSKVGSGSECTCMYQGSCIGNRYWDVERRACGLPGTSWWWYEYRNTNYTTSGPSC